MICPNPPPKIPDMPREQTYQGRPFGPGEIAKYELRYGIVKALVGYGYLEVLPPIRHEIYLPDKNGNKTIEKRYHMRFQAEAFTGEWYKLIFIGHDKLQAISRPWDFGISKFYINQNEEKPFVKRYRKEKWLDFDHLHCKVHEREKDYTKPEDQMEKLADLDLEYGAVDALGAIYKLRTYQYDIGKVVRFMVYTSEKNWWLEAHPVAIEDVTLKVGTFKSVKIKLKTFIGKELQTRGDVSLWIAKDHPNHPMVKVEGEVTFGSVYLYLEEFKAG
ncbi:MAG: DUF3108 domain-containing protein [Oligoflexales bacterium]|nr:DUF3108 domain-containing protein [Oligoflexales bacterium]